VRAGSEYLLLQRDSTQISRKKCSSAHNRHSHIIYGHQSQLGANCTYHQIDTVCPASVQLFFS